MHIKLWALPAVLRVAACSQHAFHVFDDVLAFPQYQVNWPESSVTGDEAATLLATDAKMEQYEAVVLHGQRYLCSVPVVTVDDSSKNDTQDGEQAAEEAAGELVRARERGWELLEGMRGQCIYYLGGWWSYSFCYQDEVRQFHPLPPTRGVAIYPPQEDPTVHSYILGRFPEASLASTKSRDDDGSATDTAATDSDNNSTPDGPLHSAPRLESRGATRYMAQRLPDGTPCDLTGRPRTVDVQFHCNPASPDRIALIKETSTCAYLIVIETPRLCHDVAFQPPQHDIAHSISCRPVFESVDVADAALEPLSEPEPDLANANPLRDLTDGLEGSTRRRPVIGGIEVGAHALVGSEGRVIEKSVIVGGGKEVYVATVADSEGKQLPKDEMRRLGIMDPTDVDKFKANVQRVAGRKAWKLDLVDTPRGREFRGIIETDEQDGIEGEAKGGAEKNEEGNVKGEGKVKDRGEKTKGAPKTKEGGRAAEEQSSVDDIDVDVEAGEGEDEAQAGSEETYKDEL